VEAAGVPLEAVKLTANFKLSGPIPEGLFSMYRGILNHLLDYASGRGFERLKAEKYHEARTRYPSLPSHYIYTACQMPASSIRGLGSSRGWGRGGGEEPAPQMPDG
jgi:putative transposase